MWFEVSSGGSMRWTPGGRSGNLEDRRGISFGRSGVPLGLGGILLLGILSLLFNRNFFTLLDTNSAPTSENRAVLL